MGTSRMGGWLMAIAAAIAVAWPAAGSAQEAVLTGTVADATGAVLPGVTVTAVHEATGNTFERPEPPGLLKDERRWAAVTTIYHSGGDNEQPQWSRDSIGEFQVVANRFDATQGRSSGMVVNAITKSGTNAWAGTVGGYFRRPRVLQLGVRLAF
jgi:hypothetical protein